MPLYKHIADLAGNSKLILPVRRGRTHCFVLLVRAQTEARAASSLGWHRAVLLDIKACTWLAPLPRPSFRALTGIGPPTSPQVPSFNIINGGVHAGNALAFQVGPRAAAPVRFSGRKAC